MYDCGALGNRGLGNQYPTVGMTMFNNPVPQRSLFVFIIDSPSPQDLFEGYTIGMALRDALKAIKIPHFYTLATNKDALDQAMQSKLWTCGDQMQASQPGQQDGVSIDAVPLLHICMHGNDYGVGLTDGSFIEWQAFRNTLIAHNRIKGYDPFVCMASCNGIHASKMVHAYDSVFSYLIGNDRAAFQSDLTVAYLSFYNHMFWKRSTVDQAVSAMKAASGDYNFFYAVGQQIRNLRFQETQFQFSNSGVPGVLGGAGI